MGGSPRDIVLYWFCAHAGLGNLLFSFTACGAFSCPDFELTRLSGILDLMTPARSPSLVGIIAQMTGLAEHGQSGRGVLGIVVEMARRDDHAILRQALA